MKNSGKSFCLLYYLVGCIVAYALVEAAEPSIVLPSLSGPYKVGTKAFELCDSSRPQLRGSGGRRWMVQAWYPAFKTQQGPFPYMPQTLSGGIVCGSKVYAHAQPDAPFYQKGQKFPLCIFQHGFGEVRQSYTIVCEELASHGFIILSLDQPYNSSFVRFLNGDRIVPTWYDTWKLRRDRDYRYNFYDICMKESIEDIQYILYNITALNERYFNSKLAIDCIILMGHSFGGNVAHTFGFASPHIKAVIDIDSKITEKPIYGRVGVPDNPLKKPVLFIRSGHYQEDTQDLEKVAHAEVISFPVEHSAFRDIAYLVKYIPCLLDQTWFGKLWNWFWLKGPLFDPVDTGIGDYSIDTWFAVYRDAIVSLATKQSCIKNNDTQGVPMRKKET